MHAYAHGPEKNTRGLATDNPLVSVHVCVDHSPTILHPSAYRLLLRPCTLGRGSYAIFQRKKKKSRKEKPPGSTRFLRVSVPVAPALTSKMFASMRAFCPLEPHSRSCRSYLLSVAISDTLLPPSSMCTVLPAPQHMERNTFDTTD